jgi:hypothetical protein
VYASSWLKRHEPEAFLAAMLNSQPMGFYSPSQLVQDAKRHGVHVLPVDVTLALTAIDPRMLTKVDPYSCCTIVGTAKIPRHLLAKVINII